MQLQPFGDALGAASFMRRIRDLAQRAWPAAGGLDNNNNMALATGGAGAAERRCLREGSVSKKKVPMQTIHVRLDPSVVRRVRQLADSHNLTSGVLIREAVIQWLDNPTFSRRPTGAADEQVVQ